MEYYYQFLDRDVLGRLLELSWKEFLCRWGNTRWARGAPTGDGYGSLREFISFSMSPEPSPEQVEAILARKTIRWTIQHSSPQLAAIAGLIDRVPMFRKHAVCVGFFKGSEFAALLAAAVDAYFSRRISLDVLRAVFRLHSVEDVSPWLCLSRRERQTLKENVSPPNICRPIYRWQGLGFLADEEWASCLAVADTRRLVAFVARVWRENWPVTRVKELSETSAPTGSQPPKFRDFDLAKEFGRILKTKLPALRRPAVFFRAD